MELRYGMVEIQFVDGTTETVESYRDTIYEYNIESQCFRIMEQNGKTYAMFPREFVKSIRYIEV